MHAGFVFAVALAAGIFAQGIARHLRLPGIVVLLAFGGVLGPDGLGWVEPHALGHGLFTLVDLAVAVILFEGGLNLEWKRLRRLDAPLRGLLVVAPLITWFLAAVAVRWLFAWSWPVSALFGSLVVVTGPTVIAPLAREIRLKPQIRTVLEAEGVLIDPIGAFLAVLALHVALTPNITALGHGMTEIAARLGFGALAGLAGGYALALLLKARKLVPHGLENVFTLASVMLLFEVCNGAIEHSGILAVPMAGMIVGNMDTRVDRDLREFKDQLTVLLVGLLFVLLAADVRIENIQALGVEGAMLVAFLVLVVRPLAVAVATASTTLSWQEKAFTAWIAPRGIVAAAVASLAAVALDDAGIAGGTEVRALVFLTIATTVVLAGFTASPLAEWLGLRLGERNRVVILGANGLGFALGAILHDRGAPVTFIDEDPKSCMRAKKAGFGVVFGDPLAERTLLRARIEEADTVIALTPNDHWNTLAASQAHDAFDVPRAYVALGDFEGNEEPEHVARFEGRVLFEGPHDKQRWDLRSRMGDIEILPLVWQAPQAEADNEDDSPGAATTGPVVDGASPTEFAADVEKLASAVPNASGLHAEPYAMLVMERGKSVRPFTRGLEPRKGDTAVAIVYALERENALRELEAAGWHPQPEEASAAS